MTDFPPSCPITVKPQSQRRSEEMTVSGRPPVNPDVHSIADQAKHGYAVVTRILADIQYRLAELAGLGLLDLDESMMLQNKLSLAWNELYFGTLAVVQDKEHYSYEDDNTYSDGRPVSTKTWIGLPAHDAVWQRGLAPGVGPIAEYPLGLRAGSLRLTLRKKNWEMLTRATTLILSNEPYLWVRMP